MAYRIGETIIPTNDSVLRIWSSDRWSGAATSLQATTITISYQDGTDLVGGYDLRDVLNTQPNGLATIQSVTPASQSVFSADLKFAIEQINSFARDISIQLLPANSLSDIAFFEVSGLATPSNPGLDGIAAFPDSTHPYQSYVVLDSDDMSYANGYASTGARPWIAMHELFHALGFRHNWSISGSDHKHVQGSPEDNMIFSIMSYYPGRFVTSPGAPSDMTKGFALTPMAIDIAALQIKYGANPKAKGDTDYILMAEGLADTNTSVELGSVKLGDGWYSIWDTGGKDTISFVGSSDSALINLNEAHLGNWSAELSDTATAFSNRHIRFDVPDFLIRNILDRSLSEGGFVSTTWNADGIRSGGFTVAATLSATDLGQTTNFDTGIENAHGGSGSDVLIGNAKNNKLIGGDGDDFIYGGVGGDTLEGGRGRDELNGGADGIDSSGNGLGDFVDYSSSENPIDIIIERIYQFGGDAEGDILINIENVIGSKSADGIVGDSRANVLLGGDGNDFIFGGAGGDYLDGGDDFDWIDPGYDADVDTVMFGAGGGGLTFTGATWQHSHGITIDMVNRVYTDRPANGGASLGYGSNDILIGNWTACCGTRNADHIRGDAGDNYLDGFGGDDTVFGGGGKDLMFVRGGKAYGEAGDDRLYGDNWKDDFLDGGADNDWFYALGGNDTIVLGSGSDRIHVGGERTVLSVYDFGRDDRIELDSRYYHGYTSDDVVFHVQDFDGYAMVKLFADFATPGYPAHLVDVGEIRLYGQSRATLHSDAFDFVI